MNDQDVQVEEDAALAQFMPQGFGKKGREANVAVQLEQARRKTGTTGARTAELKEDSDDGDEDEDDEGEGDDDDDDDDDAEDDYPISHELVMKTHDKSVTTLTVDPSGSRLISGSTDCTIKLHDFAAMTPTTIRAFKSVDPTATKTSAQQETHPIHHVEFNPLSPSEVLVVSATAQARIFNRDGEPQVEFIKGDMYIRDMHNTKGHVSEITTATWHPTDRNLCVTAGTDSTLRIWDVNMKRAQKDVIVHKSRSAGSGGRTRMTAVAWSNPAQGGQNLLVGAALDGSIAMWAGNGPYSRAAGEIRDAHKPDTWTSGLAISRDGRTVVTRGGDDTIKLWDTRKFKSPISVAEHLSTSSQYPTSNIIFSPDSSSILTGSQTGHLHILNPATLRPEVVTPVTAGSPLITVLWHEKLNQILTGSADSSTHVLYNPNTSTRGAAMVMSRAPKKRHIDDDSSRTIDVSEGLSGDVINPNGLLRDGPRNPTIGLTASGKSRDPRRPAIPGTTPFGKTQPDADSVQRNIPLSSMRDEDPREALLRFAEKAEKDPMFTNAWKNTQPKTLYAELSDEDEEPDKKKPKRS